MTETTDAPRSYWFVGASYGRTEDQTPSFLSEGIWENGYDDKHLDLVRPKQPGDRIAIKSSFTRKHNLPLPIVAIQFRVRISWVDCHEALRRAAALVKLES